MKLTFKNITYTKVGIGPHLCFLHGFCENRSIWDGLINELQANYTCIAIDLPGYGESTIGSTESISDNANEVNKLLRSENATRTILFGHSMGGYILADYISKFGEELLAAAFIHSTTMADSAAKKLNRQKTIDFIEKNGPKEFFRLFIPGLVSVKHLGKLREKLTSMVTSTTTSSIINGLKAMRDRGDKTAALTNFNKPVLWLKGEEDSHYPNDDVYSQAALCQVSQVGVLRAVGHLSMLEEPKKCLEEVESFLEFVDKLNSTS